MRILHSIHSVNPAAGGVIEAVRQLAVAHEADGHQVEIVSLDPPKASWVRESELTVHAVGAPKPGAYGYTAGFVPWLRSRAAQYDAVVVNGLWQYSSFAVWRAAQSETLPYFVFPHGMLDPWFKRRYPLKHLKKAVYWRLAEHRVLRDARAVLFTSEEERRLSAQSFTPFRCSQEIVPLGIAAPEENADPEVAAFWENFPQLRGKRILLFLGRLHEKKGCELLIDAWRQLDPGENFHLMLAGPAADDRYLSNLKQLAAGNPSISFPGMLSGDLKWGALRAADAFILPSHQENFGMAVVEALACGTPVLISNKVNIWREIAEDSAGIVESDDHRGTLNLMEQWRRATPVTWEPYRQRALECFRNRFEIQRTARRMIELMQARLGASLSPSNQAVR